MFLLLVAHTSSSDLVNLVHWATVIQFFLLKGGGGRGLCPTKTFCRKITFMFQLFHLSYFALGYKKFTVNLRRIWEKFSVFNPIYIHIYIYITYQGVLSI